MIENFKTWLFHRFGIGPVTLSIRDGHFTGLSTEAKTKSPVLVALQGNRPVQTQIELSVIDGTAKFYDGSQIITLWSNKDGEAFTDVQFPEQSGSAFKASLVSNPLEMVFFDGRSEGVADRILIEAPCEVSVDPGEIELLIYVYDHRNEPVSGANIELSMFLKSDNFEDGVVAELEPGIYKGKLSTHVAGNWEISASDYGARVHSRVTVCITPSKPSRIDILNNDYPRLAHPTNELIISIAVFDKYDNLLKGADISAKADGQLLEPVKKIYGDPQQYRVAHASHGDVAVEISIDNSDVILEEKITFPAAALIQDKAVWVGSEYTMPLYLFPGVENEIKEGNLEITFDENQVKFIGFNGVQTEHDLQIEHTVAGNNVQITFSSETGLKGEFFKDGLYIGETMWQCGGEGKTLFTINGSMSPQFKQCEQIMIQKQRPDPKDVCIQFLYMSPIGTVPPSVNKTVDLFEFIMNRSWKECCPTINVTYSMKNLLTDSRVKIYQAIGKDNEVIIKSYLDYRKFRQAVRSASEVDANCLSVFLIELDFIFKNGGRVLGISHLGKGPAVVDPEYLGSKSLTVAHELVHTLGVSHTDPNQGGNLMGRPLGFTLNQEQCDKIRDHSILQ